WWHRLSLGIVRDLRAIHSDASMRTVQSDFHSVPLRSRPPRTCHRLAKGIHHACGMVIVRLVINLNFISVVHRHPGLAWLQRDADVHSGVVILMLHLEHNANGTVAQLSS